MDREAVERNWPLVLQVAERLRRRMRGYWTRDELASFGLDGLLDALAKYDPDKGPWTPYARLRIRGAILDGISLHGWHFLAADKGRTLARVPAPDQPDHVADKEQARAVLDLVGPLTRQALVMHYLCGYDQTKIGKLTGVSGSAISHRIAKALRYLRAICV